MLWAGRVKCIGKNKQSIRPLIGMENGLKRLGSVADNIQNIFGEKVNKDKSWIELDCDVVNLPIFILTLTSLLINYN